MSPVRRFGRRATRRGCCPSSRALLPPLWRFDRKVAGDLVVDSFDGVEGFDLRLEDVAEHIFTSPMFSRRTTRPSPIAITPAVRSPAAGRACSSSSIHAMGSKVSAVAFMFSRPRVVVGQGPKARWRHLLSDPRAVPIRGGTRGAAGRGVEIVEPLVRPTPEPRKATTPSG